MSIWAVTQQEGMISGRIDMDATIDEKFLNPGGKFAMKADGSEYRYVYTNVDLVAADVVAQPAPSAIVVNLVTPVAAGLVEVEVELAGVTKNEFASGTFNIVGDLGAGFNYLIKENSASDLSDKVQLTLVDKLRTALDATSEFVLMPNKFHNVQKGTGSLRALGIALGASTAATDGNTQGLWVRSKGIVPVRVEGAAGALGIGVAVTPAANGGITQLADDTDEIIGVGVAAVDEYLLVDININI